MTRGVLVGCDYSQEWMLPWWWQHFCKYNTESVAFVDLGMSLQAREWCASHGKLIPLDAPKDFVMPRPLIDKELIAKWESEKGETIWKSRLQWFRKPFAMLQTPFEETIWLDLDCEVVGSIAPLFNKVHPHTGIALAPESCAYAEEPVYSTAVVAYFVSAPILKYWADNCIRLNDCFVSDQEVLSFLINGENIEVSEFSGNYNWHFHCGININATIFHWQGEWGKEVIRRTLQGAKLEGVW